MQANQFCLDERIAQIKAKILLFQALNVISSTSCMDRQGMLICFPKHRYIQG